MKTCRECGITKPLDGFKNRKDSADGKRNDCRSCTWAREARRRLRPEVKARHNLTQSARRRRNYDSAAAREDQLRRRYGITQANYEAMYKSQDGNCAVCNAHYELLVIDHDHATGTVRGLLCPACNKGLGHFRDDPILLVAGAAYLMEHEWQDNTADTASLTIPRL